MDEAIKSGFDELAGHLDYPMLIVTAADDGARAGCLLGFSTQCSIDPPRLIVFISNKNHTYGVAQNADALGVHVVPSDAEDLARLFGEETGDEVDKFARCEWEPGPLGAPVLARCGDRLVGRVVDRFDPPGADPRRFRPGARGRHRPGRLLLPLLPRPAVRARPRGLTSSLPSEDFAPRLRSPSFCHRP